jgi:hypothetical protein
MNKPNPTTSRKRTKEDFQNDLIALVAKIIVRGLIGAFIGLAVGMKILTRFWVDSFWPFMSIPICALLAILLGFRHRD